MEKGLPPFSYNYGSSTQKTVFLVVISNDALASVLFISESDLQENSESLYALTIKEKRSHLERNVVLLIKMFVPIPSPSNLFWCAQITIFPPRSNVTYQKLALKIAFFKPEYFLHEEETLKSWYFLSKARSAIIWAPPKNRGPIIFWRKKKDAFGTIGRVIVDSRSLFAMSKKEEKERQKWSFIAIEWSLS